MRVVYKQPLGVGELQIGMSSWNDKEVSVRWAYPNVKGHIARSSPEAPIEVAVRMVIMALEHGVVPPEAKKRLEIAIFKG